MHFYSEVKKIVEKEGGFREKTIFCKPHTIHQGETWNESHMVLNVVALIPDEDGHKDSFSVDLVTKKICG